MMQIVAQVDRMKIGGMHFDPIEPVDKRLRGVFSKANWGYQLGPLVQPYNSTVGDHHLPVRRFTNDEERGRLVDDTLEVAMRTTAISREQLHAVEWVLNELTDNVLLHAEADRGGFVHVNTFSKNAKRIQIAVADAGKGIPATIREGHPSLRTDVHAIGQALIKGVTRSTDVGQGNGLAGAIGVAKAGRGKFQVTSGRGKVYGYLRRNTWHHDSERVPNPEELLGTVVYFEIRTDGPIDLQAALKLEGVGVADFDYLDYRYDMDSGLVTLAVKDEVPSTGSRSAGQMLRNKATNLLSADTSVRLVLDWNGVEFVSSSFADETVGRMFAAMGPVQFNSRVQNVGMNPLVAQLVDNVILQRIRQAG